VKKLAVTVLVAFAVTLAVVAATRLSSESMAVILGMGCGMLAGMPASLLVSAVLHRRSEEVNPTRMPREYPPVVVVQPGHVGQAYPSAQYSMPALTSGGARQFRVVGEEATERSPEWSILH
jgi:hypothetical protein